MQYILIMFFSPPNSPIIRSASLLQTLNSESSYAMGSSRTEMALKKCLLCSERKVLHFLIVYEMISSYMLSRQLRIVYKED